MNKSNLAHAALAVTAQLVICAFSCQCFGKDILDGLVIGGMFSVGFYFGREVAQAERKAGTPPWYSGFIIPNWSEDAIFDFLFPLIACAIVCFGYCLLA